MSTEQELLQLAKCVSKYCVGMEGNVSCKITDGFIIKSSGCRLDSMTTSDIVYCYFGMSGLESQYKHKRPSMEWKIHEFLLSYYKYVAHTHPENVVSILCTDKADDFSKARLFPDQVVCNKKNSLLVPYCTPGNDLASLTSLFFIDFIRKYGFTPNTILLQNHGLITCGDTINQCVAATEICEKSAKIYSKSLQIGEVNLLSLSDAEKILSLDSEKYRMEK